jgi:predicted phage tail component-like protein
MANSFSFDGNDFSTYGLIVTGHNAPINQITDSVQLQDKAYAGDSKIPAKTISLDIAITADDVDTLKTNLDTIKRLLNYQEDKHLILDSLSDRYWGARFNGFSGKIKNSLFTGAMDFVCNDPYAYGAEVSNDYTDNEEPETITETPGGSALIEPLYTLTSSVLDATASIRIRNETTGMEMTWGPGAIGVGGILSIDCTNWYVQMNGVASMLLLSAGHQFPLLTPGANTIKIYGFTGNVNITYRNKYI